MESVHSEELLSIWEHIAQFRTVLLRVFAVILAGSILAFCFHKEIFSLLTFPLKSNTPLSYQEIKKERISNPTPENQIISLGSKNIVSSYVVSATELQPGVFRLSPNGVLEVEYTIPKNSLILLSPLEGFLVSMKISLWTGIAATSPAWLFLILQFILPALGASERKILFPFFGLSYLFLSIGFCFAFFFTIPIANHYFEIFNSGLGQNYWSLSQYIDYTLTLLLSNALAFELGLFLIFLVHLKFIITSQLVGKRKTMIVIAFILGAILTPPDVLTQVLLAVPLILLYECIILYSRLIEKTKKEKYSIKEEL